MGLDGSGKSKLVDGPVSSINVSGKTIYYVARDQGIFKMNLDGSDKMKISDDHGFSINIAGNWLYYRDDQDQKVFRMTLNGTDKQEVSDPKEKISQDEKDKAIKLVKEHLKSLKDVPGYNEYDTSVEFDHLDEKGRIVIHVYNVLQNQTSTINWYAVDLQNGKLEAQLKE